jgi:hypothetical protein
MEHVHQRFVEAGGRGSDAAIAFEAAEVTQAPRARQMLQRRAGSEQDVDADYDGMPAMGGRAGAAATAGAAAGEASSASSFERVVVRFQDLLPVRRQTHRRVTPLSKRRETQRRAAVAALAFISVAFGLAVAVFVLPRDVGRPTVSSSLPAGQRALDAARADIAVVFESGVDLITEDPEEALERLTNANAQLDLAAQAGVAASTINPLRDQVAAGLERLYGVTTVDDNIVFAFDPDANPPIDLSGIVMGPELTPYVLDRTTKTVWRINVQTTRATPVLREGTELGDVTAGAPKFIATGGDDVLILDVNNVLWRWRQTDEAGSLNRLSVDGSVEWGDDVRAIGTFVTDQSAGSYNLYVVDPSEQQIRVYTPEIGGDGFPSSDTWLTQARPLDAVSSIHIDGDLYIADGGSVERFSAGQPDGWEPASPGDDAIREPPAYDLITAASGRRAGRIYAWDSANARVIAWDKAEASFVEQFRLEEGNEGWTDMRSMAIVERAEGPPVLVWVSSDVLHSSRMRPIPGSVPEPSAEPSEAAGSASASP